MNRNKKILIIDDDSRNTFALNAVLKARGFKCETASAALEGLEKLKNEPEFGIVLMDMMMPLMDGYEAIATIKANSKISGIPVIAVTAQAMVGDKERCLAAGAVGYVSKPVDVDVLTELLNTYLK